MSQYQYLDRHAGIRQQRAENNYAQDKTLRSQFQGASIYGAQDKTPSARAARARAARIAAGLPADESVTTPMAGPAPVTMASPAPPSRANPPNQSTPQPDGSTNPHVIRPISARSGIIDEVDAVATNPGASSARWQRDALAEATANRSVANSPISYDVNRPGYLDARQVGTVVPRGTADALLGPQKTDMQISAAAGTGQQVETPYGPVSSRQPTWQEQLVQKYPEIGKRNSPANLAFAAAYNKAKVPGLDDPDHEMIAANVMEHLSRPPAATAPVAQSQPWNQTGMGFGDQSLGAPASVPQAPQQISAYSAPTPIGQPSAPAMRDTPPSLRPMQISAAEPTASGEWEKIRAQEAAAAQRAKENQMATAQQRGVQRTDAKALWEAKAKKEEEERQLAAVNAYKAGRTARLTRQISAY